MKSKYTLLYSWMFIAAAFLTTACNDDDDDGPPAAPDQATLIAQMIDDVRAVTAEYHDYEAGQAAGWNAQISPCVAHPELGGMGYHYARMEYMDGRVNHLEPQILLYAPDENGEMEFVGVEYVVPFAILPEDEEAPMLFFHHFHKNPIQEIWALHVWTEKHNPSGMFADWNPNVSCN